MKAIDAVNTPISAEVRDRIAELIGAEKCSMDGDVLIVKPASTEDLSKTVITVMAAKGSITPCTRRELSTLDRSQSTCPTWHPSSASTRST